MPDCQTVALHRILTLNKPKVINLILFGERSVPVAGFIPSKARPDPELRAPGINGGTN